MARLSNWVLAGALACGTPSWAGAAECHHDQSVPAAPKAAAKPPESQPSQQTANNHRPWKFWMGDGKAELQISDLQSAEIERIFQDTLPRLEALRQKLDKLEDALARTIKETKADPAALGRQLDEVNALRADQYKTRTLMLYRMRGVLNEGQRAKLQAMMDRWRKTNEPSGRR